jgi:hypothetical protein
MQLGELFDLQSNARRVAAAHRGVHRPEEYPPFDAHSFCWIFSTLLKLEAEGSITKATDGKDEGRILGGREKYIIAMRLSVENTVKNANGQIVQRILKNMELRMTSAELVRPRIPS